MQYSMEESALIGGLIAAYFFGSQVSMAVLPANSVSSVAPA